MGSDSLKYIMLLLRNQNYINIEDNCIFIKGEENFIPQILNKTIDSINYCVNNLNIKFDFLITFRFIDYKRIKNIINILLNLDTSYDTSLGSVD